MLGSFYEKAWDLDRSAQEDPHFFSSLRSRDKPKDTTHKRRRSTLHKKMHLPNDDHAVRFGSVSENFTEKRMHSNDASKPQDEEPSTNGSAHKNEHASNLNEVQLLVPKDQALSDVLDTVLTAWTILVHRYQRDLFHQFTWGVKDAGEGSVQCISTLELDLPKKRVASILRDKVGNLRSKSIPAEPAATIFLNDGTKAEVCSTAIYSIVRLTFSSGLSKYL